jgi:hypothetical protein
MMLPVVAMEPCDSNYSSDGTFMGFAPDHADEKVEKL